MCCPVLTRGLLHWCCTWSITEKVFSVMLASSDAGLVALVLPVVLTGAVLAVVLAGSEAGPVALLLPVVLAERVSADVRATAGPGEVP